MLGPFIQLANTGSYSCLQVGVAIHSIVDMLPLRSTMLSSSTLTRIRMETSALTAGKSESMIEGSISLYCWCLVSCGVMH